MRITISFSLAIAVMAAAAAPAGAQDVLQFWAQAPTEMPQAGISVVALEPVSIGEVVKDAPYSAEATTEVTQLLADGNRIERRTTATIARNRNGAVRREQQGFAVGSLVAENAQPIVTITDPASGVHITLNYEQKIAFRMKPGFFTAAVGPGDVGAGGAGAALGPRTGDVLMNGRPTFETGSRVMPPPLSPPPSALPMTATFTEPVPIEAGMAANSEYKTEKLEARTMEGLLAHGTRTTVTIPVGGVGNAMPIEIVSERWFSPELKLLLLTRRSDPRFGETVYRLTNVNQGDPSPDLFKIPSGFRIEEPKP